jgi:hypothetical protein
MHDELERIWKEAVVPNRHFLKRLRKIRKTSFTIAGAPAEIRTGDLPNVNVGSYRYTSLVDNLYVDLKCTPHITVSFFILGMVWD